MRLLADSQAYYEINWPPWWQIVGLVVAGLAYWDAVKWVSRQIRSRRSTTDPPKSKKKEARHVR
jgi:hypothetical protein